MGLPYANSNELHQPLLVRTIGADGSSGKNAWPREKTAIPILVGGNHRDPGRQLVHGHMVRSGESLEDLSRLTGIINAGYPARSEEHTSELQSLMRISYGVFCLQ